MIHYTIILWETFETWQHNPFTIFILFCSYLLQMDPSFEGGSYWLSYFPVITCSREVVTVTQSYCTDKVTMNWMTHPLIFGKQVCSRPHGWGSVGSWMLMDTKLLVEDYNNMSKWSQVEKGWGRCEVWVVDWQWWVRGGNKINGVCHTSGKCLLWLPWSLIVHRQPPKL